MTQLAIETAKLFHDTLVKKLNEEAGPKPKFQYVPWSELPDASTYQSIMVATAQDVLEEMLIGELNDVVLAAIHVIHARRAYHAMMLRRLEGAGTKESDGPLVGHLLQAWDRLTESVEVLDKKRKA